ncbi:MAG: CpsD/CapB family tyrosine-protein kinase [Oscillospiraceae bacterium]|nr:CpsD/CapB family tyrosine-protein kinase [Oscillospiraceae bacterium]
MIWSKKPKKSGSSQGLTLREQRRMLCENLDWAAAESYKQLRANLMFVLPDEKKCRIIGVTSAVRGEGKSTTSINLSYTLAETGRKVLLIDADMRIPSVAKKLALQSKPGMSNLLAGLCTVEEATQKAPLLDSWYIMPAGETPPNPSELLGSEQMQELLQNLSKEYDFIVVDLPPVNVVSDAMEVSRWISGLLMVVRADYTEKRLLSECMRRMQVLGKKVLGFVVTDMMGLPKRYKYYGYNSPQAQGKTVQHAAQTGNAGAVSEQKAAESAVKKTATKEKQDTV